MGKFLLAFSLFIISCTGKKKNTVVPPTADKQVLIQTDNEFSRMSKEKGMKAAFIEYLDSNGILLRPNEMPIVGASAVDYLISQNDQDVQLTWKPNGAVIAQSGELGFTYGVYEMISLSDDKKSYGTYVTIWKRQQDGRWKYVLDSGNDGVGIP